MVEPCGEDPVMVSVTDTLPPDSVPPRLPSMGLCFSELQPVGPVGRLPDPRGGLSQSGSFSCESERTVMENEREWQEVVELEPKLDEGCKKKFFLSKILFFFFFL